MTRKFITLMLLGMSVFLCGCPRPTAKYVRPEIPVPSDWPDSAAGQSAGPDAASRRREVAGIFHGSAASIRDRTGTGQQPRSPGSYA